VTAHTAFRRRLVVVVATLAAGVLTSRPSVAAPVLTSAQANIRFASSVECEVGLTLVVSGATEIEHRLELLDGASVELLEVRDATEARAPRDVGRTRSLVLTPSVPGGNYTFRYRVEQASARRHRCPLWLPTVPADGRTRAVRVEVDLPAGTVASGTMPAFAWAGPHGVATLAHLPAFVIVPFAAEGSARPWDVSRVMDAAAIVTLVGASTLWLRRQKGQHG